MWPFVLLGGAAVAIFAFMAGKRKVQPGAAPAPPPTTSTHNEHVDAMRAATREQAAPAPEAPPARSQVAAPIPTTDPTTLAQSAELVAAHLRKKGRNYSSAVVREFQTLAGLTADGVYGRRTRAALILAGVSPAQAPAPMGRSRVA